MFGSFLKFTGFFVLLNLLFTGVTDADMIVSKQISENQIAATTLDLSSRDTATGTRETLLFNTAGLLPGGYQVKAIRIQKDGEMTFDYDISTEIRTGDTNLCQNLKVTVLENWQTKYSGNLSEINLSRKMSESGKNDWVLVVGLENKDESLKEKSCSFDFVIKTNTKGFTDTEKIENLIKTGTW